MSALRAIREKKGFTLSQLASRAGISAQDLTEYEEGRQTVPLPHARLLAKALWVQIEDLMPPAGAALAANASQAAPPTNVAPPAPSTPRVESTPLADAGQSQSSQSGQTREEYAPPASRPTNRPDSPTRNVPRQTAQGGSQQGKPPMRERRPSAPPAPLSEG